MLSTISLWEVCKLVEKGRITSFEDMESWVKSALDMPNLRVIPLLQTKARRIQPGLLFWD